MRAIFAIALAAGLALNGSFGKAAEIRVLNGAGADDIKIIAVTGELEPGDERRFSNIAVQAKGAVVSFNSLGGFVPAAIQIGKAIRLEGFATVVSEGNTCASACALAWLGGVTRYMGNSSRVGFHAAYINTIGEKQVSSVGNALIGGYLNGLGYSESAIAYFTSAPPEGVRWLTFTEASRLGIEVRNIADELEASSTNQRAGSTSKGQPRPTGPTPIAKSATSLWNHNGSIMRLSARGPARIIAYEQPRRGMQQVGVRSGDVLFEGTRDGSALKGLARIFTPACGVWKYEVTGLVAEGDGRIELIGFAPVLDGSCKQIGTKRDFLVFEYVGRDG
jgi:hypothetical protein